MYISQKTKKVINDRNLGDYDKELLIYIIKHQKTNFQSVICHVDKVSKSGMSRSLKFYYIKDNYLLTITTLFAKILNQKTTNGVLKVKGCGMDMVFSTLYDVASTLKLKDYTDFTKYNLI